MSFFHIPFSDKTFVSSCEESLAALDLVIWRMCGGSGGSLNKETATDFHTVSSRHST